MINRVTLIGNLGRDPEMRQTQSGDDVANLSVATSETWREKNSGKRQERTEWHRVVVFGKAATAVGQYLRKGSKVYIEGKIQTRKWTDKDGNDRYTTEIVVSGFGGTVKFLDGRQDGGGGQQEASYGDHREQPVGGQASAPADDFDDEIPF